MEPIKGTPLYIGHRAWGSLLTWFFFLFILVGLYAYLHFYHPSLLYQYAIIDGKHIEYVYLLRLFIIIIFITMLIRHYQWSYIITTRQVYIKHGIIASEIHNFLYDQIQEASSFQAIGQRIFMWGQLNVTMLITLTGQSKVEEASMDYIHRPAKISRKMMASVTVGQR